MFSVCPGHFGQILSRLKTTTLPRNYLCHSIILATKNAMLSIDDTLVALHHFEKSKFVISEAQAP